MLRIQLFFAENPDPTEQSSKFTCSALCYLYVTGVGIQESYFRVVIGRICKKVQEMNEMNLYTVIHSGRSDPEPDPFIGRMLWTLILIGKMI